MVASINFKPMIASNIPKLSKGIKIGGGVIGAVGIIGLAAYYVLKDADLGDNIRPNLKWGISNAGALIMLLGLPCGGYLYLKKSNTLYFVLTRFSFLALFKVN